MQRKQSINGFYPIVFVLGTFFSDIELFILISFDYFSSNVSADELLYTETELAASMPKIETINFHQVCLLHNEFIRIFVCRFSKRKSK